jgi:hypothetical protein
MYVNTLAYGNATLCPKFEAIGEEFSDIISGSTASQPDVSTLAYSNAALFQNFKVIGEEVSEF